MATTALLSGSISEGDTGAFSVTSSGGTLVIDWLDGRATLQLQIEDSQNSNWVPVDEYSGGETVDIAPAPKEMRLEVVKANDRASVNAVFID